jgi:alkylation response protein AidB-like acyl-CoA dehydrogenase
MKPTDDHYVLNGHKWFASSTRHQNCEVLIVVVRRTSKPRLLASSP